MKLAVYNTMNRTITALILCPIFLIATTSFGATIFVSQNGQGAGSSWSDAYGDLQSAISAAESGDQIWVSKGIYFPTSCTDCSVEQRKIAFDIPQGVSLFGGFAGTETAIAQRDILFNETILNGDIGTINDRSDNSYSVITLNNPDGQNTVDGFSIINGFSNGEGDSLGPFRSGGAMHVKGNGAGNNAQIDIQNCIFTNNRSDSNGGAIHFYGGFSGSCQFQLINCHFQGNLAKEKGAAIFGYSSFDGNLQGELTNCKFVDNRAKEGGAIYTLSSEGTSTLNYSSVDFLYNIGENMGGAIVSFTPEGSGVATFNDCLFKANESDRGGALFLDGSNNGMANDQYDSCIFLKNKAIGGGGAIYANGTGGLSSASYKNCLFDGNFSVQSGAALFNSGSSNGECISNFDKCKFIRNRTTMYGAAMYNFGKTGQSSPVITNCLFAGNEADSGASIYNYGGQSGISNPRIINCTFTTNIARVGPCVYNQASDTTGTVKPFVSNCIFWDNTATSGFGLVFQNGHAEPTIQYSLIPFDDCDLLNTQPNSTLTCGPGIIFNEDPKFINASIANFRLSANSPALNFGVMDNAIPDDLDLDSKNRMFGTIDLGPYEFDSTALTQIVTAPLDNEYCQSDSAFLFIETYGEEPLGFQWYFNGTILSGENLPFLTIDPILVENEGEYFCEVETNNGNLNSTPAKITVTPSILPEVVLIGDEQFCQGQGSKTVQAQLNNEGYFPQYSWYLNEDLQTVSTLFFDFQAADQDKLVFELSSSERCAVSDTTSSEIVFEELLELEASAAIIFDQSSYCENDLVQLEADLTNAGDQPMLTWLFNNQSIASNVQEIMIADGVQGDEVKLLMTSSLNCVSVANVESPNYTLEFLPVVVPDILISFPTDTICKDSLAVFTASLEHGGANPEIDWFVNGEFSSTESELNWETIFSEFQTFEIAATLHSDEICADMQSVSSNILTIESVDCMTSAVRYPAILPSNIYPNPADNLLIIESDFSSLDDEIIQIYNEKGMLVKSQKLTSLGENQAQISTNELSNGMYFGRITGLHSVILLRFSVLR